MLVCVFHCASFKHISENPVDMQDERRKNILHLAFQGYFYSSIIQWNACDVFLKSYFWDYVLSFQSSNEILNF